MAFLWIKSRANGDFVCAEGGGGGALVANRDYIWEWESFVFEDLDGATELRLGNRVTLRAAAGQYVCAELNQPPQKPLMANRAAPNAWEQFTLEPIPGFGETWGTLVDNENRVQEHESRKPVGTPCAIRSADGSYWSARLNEGGRMTSEAGVVNAWEHFEVGFAGANVARPVYNVWRNNVAPFQ